MLPTRIGGVDDDAVGLLPERATKFVTTLQGLRRLDHAAEVTAQYRRHRNTTHTRGPAGIGGASIELGYFLAVRGCGRSPSGET
jgi:hypothetical protein